MNKKFSIIDLETTGTNRDGQKIIEIAIINFDGGFIEETFSTLINPEKYVSHQISLITGITNEMLSDKPKFYEVAKKIVEMTEGRTIVAHNVFFDYRFLQREFRDLGFSFHRQVFCTCSAFRRTFPGHTSYSLKNLCADLGVIQQNPHRALSDAENCLELLKILNESAAGQQDKQDDVDHLIPSQLGQFTFNDYPESPGLYFMYDKDNVLLYVGKSINIRARLRQHFKQFSGMAREHEMKSRVVRVECIECYHDLPTSLLELHFIKTMRPHYNISGRRKHFKYGLKLCLNSENLIAGEELKITSSIELVPLIFCYGSKRSATVAKEQIYKRIFGVQLEDFSDGIHALKRQMGADVFYEKIRQFYTERHRPLSFPRGEKWALNLDNDSLKSIWIEGRGEIPIEETPDMRWVLINQVKKKLSA